MDRVEEWRHRVVTERRNTYYSFRHFPDLTQEEVELLDRNLKAAWEEPPPDGSFDDAIAEIVRRSRIQEQGTP
jgi:hypothetical protein